VTETEKAARNAANKERYWSDEEYRELLKRRARESRARRREKINAERRQRYREDESFRRECRNIQLKSKFGLSLEDYENLVEEQQGRCAICCLETKPLAVDHCHNSKKIRGLLCGHCNTGLGKFRDDPARLERAIAYLGQP
jgi:hypothetical protein